MDSFQVERNYTVLSKWTRKVDLFKMDYVVVPVVDDLHWLDTTLLNMLSLL